MKKLLEEIKTYHAEKMHEGNWQEALQLYMRLPSTYQDKNLIRSFMHGKSTYKLIDPNFNIWKGIISRMEYAITGQLSQTPIAPIAIAKPEKKEEPGRKENIETLGKDYLKNQMAEMDTNLETKKATLSNLLNQVPEGDKHNQQRKKLATEIMGIEETLRNQEKAQTMTDNQKQLQEELEKLESKRRNAASTRKKWEIKQAEEVDADEDRKEEIAGKIKHYAAAHAKFDSDVDEMRARIEATA